MNTEKFARIKSGIPGLDEIICGGLPFPSTILLAGGAGTGKTTFSYQFLFEGARNGEKCLYFTTLSEPPIWLMRFTSGYSFIDEKYFGKEIKYVDLSDMLILSKPYKDIIRAIENEIIDILPQRIVIDPLILGDIITDYRKFVYELSIKLKSWQATTVITCEVLPSEEYPLDLACTMDAVVLLTNEFVHGKRKRFLEVLKMRGTAHSVGKKSIKITDNGISVILS